MKPLLRSLAPKDGEIVSLADYYNGPIPSLGHELGLIKSYIRDGDQLWDESQVIKERLISMRASTMAVRDGVIVLSVILRFLQISEIAC